AGGCRGKPRGQAADDVERGGTRLAALAEGHRLPGPGRERRVAAGEAGTQHGRRRVTQAVMHGEPGDEAEEERAAHVDRERAEREVGARAVLDDLVDDVPRD